MGHPYSSRIRLGNCPVRNVYQGSAPRVLFVCTMGMLRSATMATLAAQRGINARACGTDPDALVPITETLITWADTVVFAEAGHQVVARAMFPEQTQLAHAAVWDLPDVHEYMAPALQRLIQPLMAALQDQSAHHQNSMAMEGE